MSSAGVSHSVRIISLSNRKFHLSYGKIYCLSVICSLEIEYRILWMFDLKGTQCSTQYPAEVIVKPYASLPSL